MRKEKAYHFTKFAKIAAISSFFFLQAGHAATFNNLITLSDFGIVTNQNISLQPASRYASDPANQLLRTNDFQTLQLNFGDYAAGRLPCRVGVFNVSESAVTTGSIPFGSKLELAAYTIAGSQTQNIEPNRFLEQGYNPQFLVFSFMEALNDVVYDFTETETFTTCDVIYQNTATEYMKNINLPTTGYHDVYYDELTPNLVFGSGILSALYVDGKQVSLPTSNTTLSLPAGEKFKFVFSSLVGEFEHQEIWLLYVQSDVAETKIQFNMNYLLTKEDRMTNIAMQSQSGVYKGYLRTAVIQTEMPPSIRNCIRPKTVPKWELDAMIQSMPATPLSMFMLWPYDWTKSVGAQIIFNQAARVYISDYQTASLLLPLLARSNYPAASCWFNQLMDKQIRGETVFSKATNSFVTLMNMLIATNYDADIQSFQNSIARGVSTPFLGIGPNATQMETMFDAHKSQVVLAAELEFNSDGTYSYTVNPMDVVDTFPTTTNSLPLFSFPGFKTLADGFNIIANATNKDPIKGDINYVEGNIGTTPGSYYLTFKGQSMPSWASRFLPDDFWIKISGANRTNLVLQLNSILQTPLPGISSSTYEQGLLLFQIAMTAKYATYVLLAQKGILPPYPVGYVAPSDVAIKVQPFINYIEEVLNAWLITRTYSGQALTNYFVADDEAEGIVAVIGTTSPTGGTEDSGNAVYTGHNRQYGYFLGSAAIAMQLDQLLGNTPWIASTETNAVAYSGEVKQFVDVLWRDYANPATDDPDGMPFYRYGNPWEGISSSKGVPPVGAFVSRNNESISEDFNGYYAAWLYSRAIQNSPTSVISSSDQQGFNILETFSQTNLSMIMRGAKGMFYNWGYWVYKDESFDFNKTMGTLWDNRADTNVDLEIGTPSAIFTTEGCMYSQYKFNLFADDLVESFNSRCGCTNEGCNCETGCGCQK